jgi:hypothetical protein
MAAIEFGSVARKVQWITCESVGGDGVGEAQCPNCMAPSRQTLKKKKEEFRSVVGLADRQSLIFTWQQKKRKREIQDERVH